MTYRTSCLDWRERIVARRSLVPAPLYADEAEAALAVFKSLRIVDAPGQPTFGEACEPFVFDFVRAIFGAYDAKTGRRLIREFFLLISKKNSKSTIAAGIMVTALIVNWRHSAELLILAPTIEIAQNAFQPARDMIRADAELDSLLHIQEHTRTITHRVTKAVLKVVAADTDTVSGKKAAFIFIDELWIFGKRPKADSMLREATGGLVSRPEGFVIWASTQSDEPPAGVFKTKLNYFRNVRDGIIEDPKSLPVIYEFPESMIESQAYLRPENFYITNPNIGRSVDRAWLEEELVKVSESQGGERQVFLAKHLNVEIGLALRSDRWPGAEFWEDAAYHDIQTLDDLIARCDCATMGVDGGGLDDLFGCAVVGRERETRQWLVWTHTWCHEVALKRRKSEAARYMDFARAGEMTIIDRPGGDIAGVVDIALRLDAAGILAAIGMDPVGVGSLVDALELAGLGGDDRIVGVSQGYKLMGAVKTTERKVADGTLRHGGQAIMAYCVGNARKEVRGNAELITKQASGTGKIDTLMALFDAVACMSTNPEPVGGAPEIFVI